MTTTSVSSSETSFASSEIKVLIANRRWDWILAAFFFIIKQSPAWMMPYLLAPMIDAAIHPTPEGKSIVVRNGIILSLLIIQNVPTHTIFARFLSRGCRSIQMELRTRLIEKFQQLSLAYHDSKPSGSLQSKILRDVDQVELSIRWLLNNGWGSLINLVATIVICVISEPRMLIYFIITCPFAIILTKAFRKKMEKYQREFRTEVEGMSGRLQEMLSMIPVSRAHALEDLEVHTMRRSLQAIHSRGQSVDWVMELFGSSAWATFQLFYIGSLVFAIWLAWHGTLTPGQVVMFQGYFGMTIGSVTMLLQVVPQLTQGKEAMRSIDEILESKEVETHDEKSSVEKVEGRFSLENLSFHYANHPERPSLHELNLEFKPGECIAVIGASGAGKTTLMNLIIGFNPPTSGVLRLDGRDMTTLNLKEYRRFIAVVPQQTVLFSGSIRENMTYGITNVTPEHFDQVLKDSRVADFLDQLPHGIETRVGERGAKLSGGQRQRIAIARAMMRNPRVLIMDEATSALDSETEKKIQEAMHALVKGRTTFIVAHRLSTIRDADRIVVLNQGHLVETGSPEELLQKKDGWYRRYLELQS
ncbi:MAG: ABC transporter ATP-binding protein [Verrucomicrobiota bacterium]